MPSQRRLEVIKPVAIAVEGADYFHVLLSQLDRPEFENVQLFNFMDLPTMAALPARGDNASLKRWLELFNKANSPSTAQVLGIIRDAENDGAKQFVEIQRIVRDGGWVAPNSMSMVQRDAKTQRATGILILPVGQNAGCLEHALLAATSAKVPEKLRSCAANFLKCVDTPARNDNWRAKVQVHAIIAGSDRDTQTPAMSLGQSAQAGYWDFDQPPLKPVIDFVRDLQSHVGS